MTNSRDIYSDTIDVAVSHCDIVGGATPPLELVESVAPAFGINSEDVPILENCGPSPLVELLIDGS